MTGILGNLLRRVLFGRSAEPGSRERGTPVGDDRLRDIGRRVKEQLRGTAGTYENYDVDEERARRRPAGSREDDGE